MSGLAIEIVIAVEGAIAFGLIASVVFSWYYGALIDESRNSRRQFVIKL